MHRSTARQKIAEVARQMPPLHHKHPGQDYDIRRSDVVRWIINQTEVREIIWNMIKQSGAITYDTTTKTWSGIDYHD